MKKSSTLLIGIGAAIVGCYLIGVTFYSHHFLPNTRIDGIAISGKTVPAAKSKITDQLANETFTLFDGQTQVASFTGKKAGLVSNFSSELNKLKQTQNAWSWPVALFNFTGNVQAKEVMLKPTAFNQYFDTLYNKLNKNRTASKNATITKADHSFSIKAESQGNSFDQAKLKQLISNKIAANQTKIQINSTYLKPTLKSSDEKIKNDLKLMQKISQENVTYKINSKTEKISKSDLYDWLTYKDQKVSLDQAAVLTYVNNLGSEYNTHDHDLKFKSTKQGTVTVPSGTYGWSIQPKTETAGLSQEILKGEDFTRTPVVAGSGQGYNRDQIGNSYVEVDKKNQHEWVYLDGKLKYETDVITGKTGQDTPSGAFFVWNKQRDATLRGQNDDGSDYASKVSYWMPIDYTGVGLHDSPWQTNYGGTTYQTKGSHGCVNTPPETMAKIYEDVPVGTPVIVI